MFRCDECRAVQPPRTPQHIVVTQKRPRTYVLSGGRTSQGWEIAHEQHLCDECYQNSPFSTKE